MSLRGSEGKKKTSVKEKYCKAPEGKVCLAYKVSLSLTNGIFLVFSLLLNSLLSLPVDTNLNWNCTNVYENLCCPGKHQLKFKTYLTSGCWGSICYMKFLLVTVIKCIQINGLRHFMTRGCRWQPVKVKTYTSIFFYTMSSCTSSLTLFFKSSAPSQLTLLCPADTCLPPSSLQGFINQFLWGKKSIHSR